MIELRPLRMVVHATLIKGPLVNAAAAAGLNSH